jgi:hypothetical protein
MYTFVHFTVARKEQPYVGLVCDSQYWKSVCDTIRNFSGKKLDDYKIMNFFVLTILIMKLIILFNINLDSN